MQVSELQARISKLKHTILNECEALAKETGFKVSEIREVSFSRMMSEEHPTIHDVEVVVVKGQLKITL